MSPVDAPDEDLLRTAIHEAGHTIVALYYSLPIRRITVRRTKREAGHVSFKPWKHRANVEPFALICIDLGVTFGGVAAETVFLGDYCPSGASDDFTRARDSIAMLPHLSKPMHLTAQEGEGLLAFLYRHYVELLSNEPYRSAVYVVADALIERTVLGPRQIDLLLRGQLRQGANVKITDPVQYLRHRADANKPEWNIEGFVLRHGTMFEHVELDADENAVVDDALTLARRLYGNFEPKQCFANSQRIVLCDQAKKLAYVEGYAIIDGIVLPLPHAWVTIKGKIVDVTLPRATERRLPGIEGELGPEPPQGRGIIPGRKYLGVPFRREYVEARMAATNSMSVLLVDHRDGRSVIACDGVGAVAHRTECA